MKHPIWKKIFFVLSIAALLATVYFCLLTFDGMVDVRNHYAQHLTGSCTVCLVGLTVFGTLAGCACTGAFALLGSLLALFGRNAWDGKIKKATYSVIAILVVSFLAALVAAIIAYGMQK